MRNATCPDCGAPTDAVSCAELFDVLLALDHSRALPWGPLHGQAVACYFLQHPTADRAPAVAAPLLAILESFVADEHPDGETPPTDRAVTTIHDLAVDGSFPATGYGERLLRWADHIVRKSR